MNMPMITEDRLMCESEWGHTEFESKTLRNLLGCYPTGVAIVTTRTADGRDVGLTINSFASLSLDPPLVLWSLVNHSPNLAVFRDCTHFTINILAKDHQELALRFANPRITNKFEDVAMHITPEGIPALHGAIATLVCENHKQDHIGDHLLMIGHVRRIGSENGKPLVFHSGSFTALHDAQLAQETL